MSFEQFILKYHQDKLSRVYPSDMGYRRMLYRVGALYALIRGWRVKAAQS